MVGYIKGKIAIHLARGMQSESAFLQAKASGRVGIFLSTVGQVEAVIRNYIRHQEKEVEHLEQLGLWR